jgi:hypothetical protein
MKKQILKTIGVPLAVLVVAVFAQVWVSAQDNDLGLLQGGYTESSLRGSWDVRVTVRDCQTGAPIPFIPIFPAIMTFDEGGTLQETDLGGPGIVRLPGHGVWERRHGRQYSVAFRFLNFAPDRTFLGTNVVRSSITLAPNGRTYTATATGVVLDANGNVVPGSSGCATETAKRFE